MNPLKPIHVAETDRQIVCARFSPDGATLAFCLAGLRAADIPAALRRYETLRLARTARVQGESEANKTRHHLPDGPAQQARDAQMARGGTDFSAEAMRWLYGFDAGAPEVLALA